MGFNELCLLATSEIIAKCDTCGRENVKRGLTLTNGQVICQHCADE